MTIQDRISGIRTRLDSFVNSLTGLGGAGDKGAAGVVAARTRMSTRQLDTLYEINGYAARVIDKPAEDATAKGWRINDGSKRDSDPMAAFDRDLKVRAKMGEALKQARLYGGALVVIVTDEEGSEAFSREAGSSPEQLLAQPLDLDKVKQVLNLAVFNPQDAQAVDYTSDIRDPNYRLPSMWRLTAPAETGVQLTTLDISAADELLVKPGTAIDIHHSRVLYIPGKKTSARQRYRRAGWDLSLLEAFYDQIRNITTTEQALAVLIQELKLDVIQLQDIANLSAQEQCELFEERMRLLVRSKAIGGAVLLGEGEAYHTYSAQLSGVDAVHTAQRFALSAVTGIAQVILFGDTPGGLNSDGESHKNMHQTAISAIHSHIIKDPLRQLYKIAYACSEGPTADITEPEEWKIHFHPIYTLTDTEQGALEKTHAETDAIRINSGTVLPEHVTASRYSDEGYQNELLPVDLKELEESALAEAELLRQQMQEMEDLAPSQEAASDVGDETPSADDEDSDDEDRQDERQRRLDYMASLSPQMLRVLAIPGVSDLVRSLIGESPIEAALKRQEEQTNERIRTILNDMDDMARRMGDLRDENEALRTAIALLQANNKDDDNGDPEGPTDPPPENP